MTEGKGFRDAKKGSRVPQCGREISRPGKGDRDAQTASGICGIAKRKHKSKPALSSEEQPTLSETERVGRPGRFPVGRVTLDKSEGVVKRHFFSSMRGAPRRCQRRLRTEAPETLTVNQLSAARL